MLGLTGLSALLLAGCASTGVETEPHDPFEDSNRSIFAFNKALDDAVLAPLSRGYVAITTEPTRQAIFNVFDNLGYLTTMVNQFLQGKVERGFEDAGRFIINSTFGLGGLVDFATAVGIERNEEDFDQTLAVWGVPPGPYLELPLLGPNVVRGLPAIPADWLTDISTYANTPYSYAITGVKVIDTRARLDPAIRLRDKSSLDPYVFQREAFLQRRRHLIYDGNPPLEEFAPPGQ